MSYQRGLEILGIDLDGLRSNATTCPRCSQDRKKKNQRCLSVSLKTGNYECHHCGWKGRADSSEWLDKQGFSKIEEAPIYQLPEDNFKPANGIAGEYLQKRGIPVGVIERNKIGETPYQVVFRYYQSGRLIRAKMRKIKEKGFTQIPNCRPLLYKIDDIKESSYCIITEGEIDALSWEAAGISEAVSLDGGALKKGQVPGGKFSCVVSAMPYLENKKRVFIAMDNDDPGRYTAIKLAEFIGVGKCYQVKYPAGCKDANDVLLKHGPDQLIKAIKEAEPFGLIDIASGNPLLQKALSTRFDYSKRVEEIPAILSVEINDRSYDVAAPGQIGIFSGHEKSGKSFLLECIAASCIGGGLRKVGFSMILGDKKLIWFDTEQSQYFYQLNQRRLYNMAGISSNNRFYDAYHLRRFTAPERADIIEAIIYSEANLGAVVIDGFVDLLLDYNSLEESQVIVNRLMKWTDEKDILLMGILHLNKGDSKLRGHLGSELKNKCDFQITVSKDDNAYLVKNPTSRYMSFPSFDFRRDENGLPVSHDDNTTPF